MDEAQTRLKAVRRGAEENEAGDWRSLEYLAREMDEAGRGRDEPVREVFSLIGDRWTMLLLLTLQSGPWRHATLRRIVGALSSEGEISQRVLTLKLRALERDGFLIRTVTQDVPPKVDYRLSGLGQSLLERAREMLEWVRAKQDRIVRSRQEYDSRDQP